MEDTEERGDPRAQFSFTDSEGAGEAAAVLVHVEAGVFDAVETTRRLLALLGPTILAFAPSRREVGMPPAV